MEQSEDIVQGFCNLWGILGQFSVADLLKFQDRGLKLLQKIPYFSRKLVDYFDILTFGRDLF